jgi:hypothetical protein
VREIKNKAIDTFNFYSETKQYVYDSIFFEHVYGLYDTCDDLDASWVKGKSDEKLMAEVKENMLEELKKWNNTIKPYLCNNYPFALRF